MTIYGIRMWKQCRGDSPGTSLSPDEAVTAGRGAAIVPAVQNLHAQGSSRRWPQSPAASEGKAQIVLKATQR